MNNAPLVTENLTLVLRSQSDVQEELENLDPTIKAQFSPDWLRRVCEATAADPWVHGFKVVHRSSGKTVGTAGFKAPPGEEGMVEIAYRIEPEQQNKGYATEAAAALTAFALDDERVRLVRAHTLPETNASTRVLTKCGFRFVGDVLDPEDGMVWRWEKQ